MPDTDPDYLDGLPAPEQRIAASPARRFLVLAAVYILGAIMVLGAFQADTGAMRMLALMLLGAAFLFAAERLRRATLIDVIVDARGLSDSTGAVLARWDDIESIDRGTFANKPSNGFSVVLVRKRPGGWAPGIWWSIGRRVGVGGVLPGRPTRFMGEQMAVYLVSRRVTEAAARAAQDQPDAEADGHSDDDAPRS